MTKFYGEKDAKQFSQIVKPYYLPKETFSRLQVVHKTKEEIKKENYIKEEYKNHIKKLKKMVSNLYKEKKIYMTKKTVLQELNKRMLEEAKKESLKTYDKHLNRRFEKVKEAFGGRFENRRSLERPVNRKGGRNGR